MKINNIDYPIDSSGAIPKINSNEIIYTLNDNYHRIDGPAVIYCDKNGKISNEYWYNNEIVDCDDQSTYDIFLEFISHINDYPIDSSGAKPRIGSVELGIIYTDDNGLLHRNDGPAIIDIYGGQFWYQYGDRHRLNGPAIIQKSNQWFYGDNEVYVSSQEEFEKWLKLNVF